MTPQKLCEDRINEISAILDCPKARVVRVAVALLQYCMKTHTMEYFHYYKKLKDDNY